MKLDTTAAIREQIKKELFSTNPFRYNLLFRLSSSLLYWSDSVNQYPSFRQPYQSRKWFTLYSSCRVRCQFAIRGPVGNTSAVLRSTYVEASVTVTFGGRGVRVEGGGGGGVGGRAAGRPLLGEDGGEWIEGDDGDPRAVALAARHHAPLRERPDGDQVVLAAAHHQLAVGRPARAQKAAEVGSAQADQLHALVVQHAQAAVLRRHRQVLAARREGQVVDGALAHHPPAEKSSFQHLPTSENG